MPSFSYLWHDYEATGLNPRRDRPTQFAAIRTDADLNEIGDPINIFCKPLPDMIPHLEACMVTGISPQHCEKHGIPEYQFADEINRALGAPGTIGVGFNTIKFDDEFTRNLLWRNLADPYAREWKNGCGRWDIVDLVRVAYALRPEGIVWPKREDGEPTFKLEDLARANGIAHDSAHDALSDVRATIALARLIRNSNRRLFDYCLALHRKDAVAAQVGFGKKQPFIHVSGVNAKDRGCLSILYPIAMSDTNKNEFICWDLLEDPDALLTADGAQVKATMFKRTHELAEGEVKLPLRTIATNKSPMVFQDMRVLSAERAALFGLDPQLAMANLAKLQAVMTKRDVPALLREIYRREEKVQDPEDDLYGAFVSSPDRAKLDAVRALFADSPTMLAQKIGRDEIVFGDARLTELVFRFRARHAPQTLTKEEAARWADFACGKIVKGRGDHHTAGALIASLHEKERTTNGAHTTFLQGLMDYAWGRLTAFSGPDHSLPEFSPLVGSNVEDDHDADPAVAAGRAECAASV